MHFSLLLLITLSAAFAEESTDNPPYRKTSKAGHEMRIVNSGTASLYARLDMIRRAEKSIEMETFILNPDTSGRLVMKELAAAAKRGVKVRVLVDKSAAVFKMDEHYARELKEAGVEMRYYNPAPLLKLSSVQFRNHRKLMVRDGVEAIAGGRNIGDEYYDLSDKFNFLDRDATVEGEIVGTMKESFDKFWTSDIVEIPKEVKEPAQPTPHEQIEGNTFQYESAMIAYKEKQKKARELLAPNKEDEKIKKFIMEKGKEAFEQNKKYNCPEVAFASDKEGGAFAERLKSTEYHDQYRLLRKEIGKWMDTRIKDEVIVDSPYFLNNQLSEDIAANLIKEKKRIKILTNSLASTDAIYVSTVFNETVKKYTPNENFEAHIYKGKFSGENELYNDKIKNSVWGTHSKTMVFNDEAFMVGTFNIDNRSSFYNTELALFCNGSKELTQDVKSNIEKRMQNSYRLNAEGVPDDCSDLLGDVSGAKKALYYLLKLPSHILQFLL